MVQREINGFMYYVKNHQVKSYPLYTSCEPVTIEFKGNFAQCINYINNIKSIDGYNLDI